MWKNRLTYALVTVVLFLFIYLQEHRMTYMAFYAVLMMPILSYLLGIFSRRYFSISEQLSSHFMTKGEEVVYTVKACNRSFLPCSFARIRLEVCEVGLDIQRKETYFSLLPYKNHEFTFQIKGIYRGAYMIGIKDIIFYDFLGLFQFKRSTKKLHQLLITPRIITITDLLLDTATGDEGSSKNEFKGEDYSNIAELRAFRPTDNYRQIHWKVSAKKGALISKTFHEQQRHAATFFVDNVRLHRDLQMAMALEDKLMEMVVSAMSYCYRAGYPISMQVMSGKQVDFTTDFARLYEEASKLKFVSSSDFNVLLNNYLSLEQDPMNLFVFPATVNDVLFNLLKSLVFIGNHITIFLFKNSSKQVIDKLNMLDVTIIFIDGVNQVS